MDSRVEKMFAHRVAPPGTQIKTGVGVIVRGPDDRILLERRADCGLWGLLGGRVDPGESVSATAIREVLEESGLHIEVIRLLGIYSEPATHILVYPDNGDIRHLIDIVVEARVIGGTLRLSHESECIEFFALDALPREEEIVLPAREPLADLRAGRCAVLR